MSTTVALMNLSEVAHDLSVTPLEVLRLIARKQLRATRLGDSGPYRVTVANLEDYVNRGAADLRLPEYTADRAWFDDSLAHLADGFSTAIVEASAEQVPSDEALRGHFETDPRSSTLDYTLKVRGAVAEVLKRPVPVSPFTPRTEQTDSRFLDWAEAFATYTLRKTARQAIQGRNQAAPLLTTLYQSPKDFTAITGEAYAAAAKRNIVFSKMFSFTGGPFGLIPVQRRAMFVFSLANLFTASAMQRLLRVAF